MDLQAIGIVLASQRKANGCGFADEDQYYQDMAAGRHVAVVVEMVATGFTQGLSGFAHMHPKKLRSLWKSTSQ